MLSFDVLDFYDDESDNDEAGYDSIGTCDFPCCSGIFVGCVSGIGYGFFALNGIESIGDVVLLVVSVPKGVNSRGG